ncbi:hypothetical protein [Niallia sp. RD1]|uniref:hypothetical protein n=1 Tax=Niallia sp. RD1 TaxID=2962858 RepID=UPI0020C1916F|nr:hypothetical protein [Niallia sp. RD1]UTI42087.1 hypothetical protein NKG37_25285 [Niallia sp. RD1]
MKSKLLNIVPVVIFSAVLFGCSDGSEPKEEKKSEDTTEVNVKEEKAETTEEATESEPEEVSEEEQSTINTDVFEYATKTEVTNAIDINDHVTVFVYMSEDLKPGLAAQHVLNQTYDFIQQEDVKDAKTISINVKQGDTKILMYTVETDKFKPNEEIPMSDLVLDASEVEFMTKEVEEAAEVFEWNL